MKTFRDMQSITVRVAARVQPGLIIEANGVHYQ